MVLPKLHGQTEGTKWVCGALLQSWWFGVKQILGEVAQGQLEQGYAE